MEYIVKKRYKKITMSGKEANLKRGAICQTREEDCRLIICADGVDICDNMSQDAYDYFARNNDGMGLERAKLIDAITKLLDTKDDEHQARWDRLWESERAQCFRRKDHEDHWLWAFNFYNADVADLEYILQTAKGE